MGTGTSHASAAHARPTMQSAWVEHGSPRPLGGRHTPTELGKDFLRHTSPVTQSEVIAHGHPTCRVPGCAVQAELMIKCFDPVVTHSVCSAQAQPHQELPEQLFPVTQQTL